ncbi:carbonic anhydrase/acetyltransferase-like protein (isoleucine patch superfamily) [Ammoniphilus resinae]|uniref:Carbonic anhydrase/acetyltransferase-like protein (Isoleucine patch superfamily) n=1 Tax=Ammoniphilus resinae TaxID=861532 RepID=A0ABS4GX67_9BACL|nr:carbonic anhydrase/acetyltransferase-like protein (isoleucine patch superfamily) [Ammoniphilus resinae]
MKVLYSCGISGNKGLFILIKKGCLVLGLSAAARQLRNSKRREWYKQNKEKQKQYNERYWEKKAEQLQRA